MDGHNAAIYMASTRNPVVVGELSRRGMRCNGAEGASKPLDVLVDWHALHRVIDTFCLRVV